MANPRTECVTEPKDFPFFGIQKSCHKSFFMTHTFDSGGFFTFLAALDHGAPVAAADYAQWDIGLAL